MADYTFTTLALEPTAKLRWSKDGGHTWSNWRSVPFGRIGEYQKRAVWRQIGQARDIIFEIEVSSQSKVALLGASADMSGS